MKAVLIGTLIVAALLLPAAIFFVSIVWTHRPDLTLLEIEREAVREIKNKLAEDDDPQRKGKKL